MVKIPFDSKLCSSQKAKISPEQVIITFDQPINVGEIENYANTKF